MSPWQKKTIFPIYSLGIHLKASTCLGRVALSGALTLDSNWSSPVLQNLPKQCCRKKEKANYLQLAQRILLNSKRHFRLSALGGKQILLLRKRTVRKHWYKKSVLRCHKIFGKLLVSVWKLLEVTESQTDVHIWQCVSSTCWHTCAITSSG